MIFSSHMRGHSGLVFTLSAALLLMVLSSTVDAVTLKIATLAPDGTSWMKQMRKGAAEISTQTDGRVKIKLYPGGVMGNTNTVLQKIKILLIMGIAVDTQQNSFVVCHTAVVLIEIESLGLAVQFQKTASCPGLLKDSSHVDIVGLTL